MEADNINETTLTRKPRPVGGELYFKEYIELITRGLKYES